MSRGAAAPRAAAGRAASVVRCGSQRAASRSQMSFRRAGQTTTAGYASSASSVGERLHRLAEALLVGQERAPRVQQVAHAGPLERRELALPQAQRQRLGAAGARAAHRLDRLVVLGAHAGEERLGAVAAIATSCAAGTPRAARAPTGRSAASGCGAPRRAAGRTPRRCPRPRAPRARGAPPPPCARRRARPAAARGRPAGAAAHERRRVVEPGAALVESSSATSSAKGSVASRSPTSRASAARPSGRSPASVRTTNSPVAPARRVVTRPSQWVGTASSHARTSSWATSSGQRARTSAT